MPFPRSCTFSVLRLFRKSLRPFENLLVLIRILNGIGPFSRLFNVSRFSEVLFRKSPRPLFTLKEGSNPIPSPFPSKGKGVHRPLARLRYRQRSLCPKGLPICFKRSKLRQVLHLSFGPAPFLGPTHSKGYRLQVLCLFQGPAPSRSCTFQGLSPSGPMPFPRSCTFSLVLHIPKPIAFRSYAFSKVLHLLGPTASQS